MCVSKKMVPANRIFGFFGVQTCVNSFFIDQCKLTMILSYRSILRIALVSVVTSITGLWLCSPALLTVRVVLMVMPPLSLRWLLWWQALSLCLSWACSISSLTIAMIILMNIIFAIAELDDRFSGSTSCDSFTINRDTSVIDAKKMNNNCIIVYLVAIHYEHFTST